MKDTETPSLPASHVGHVKNGVIVLDADVALTEGQAVRVEPIQPSKLATPDAERVRSVQQLRQLFDRWTDEDAQLSEEEADRLQDALGASRGLHFRLTDS